MENNPPPPPPLPPPPPTSGGYPPPPPGPGDPYPTYQGAAMGAQGYAGFWIRFVAYLIDVIIVSVPLGIIARILDPNMGSLSDSGQGVYNLVSLVVSVLYFSLLWANGGTLGMRLLGMRVADANTGEPIPLGRSFLRYLGLVISTIPCLLGLIWAAFDSRKQGWHDKIATTVVLRN